MRIAFVVDIMQDVLKKNVRAPQSRQGKSHHEWSKPLKCYLSLHGNDLAQTMGIAEVSEVWKDLSAERREADRVLYYSLSMVVNDKYLAEVQRVTDESGVEAWRLLQRRFGEVDPTRSLRLLSNTLSPSFSTGDPIDGADKWM